jgi:imidazole glycerol phosphate synthase glutamine amidotransferase subunit
VIGVVDGGSGNLRSLENALVALGRSSRRVAAPEGLAGVDPVILPGVGHFGAAARSLKDRGLDAALRTHVTTGGRLLGICLGMQLLFEGSAEAPGVPGLGLLPGTCAALDAPGLKVPHMGWNRLVFSPGNRRVEAYFVHSFAVGAWPADRPADWTAVCAYGREFLAAFRAGNLVGCQFHPEKSGRWGLAFLEEVLAWS